MVILAIDTSQKDGSFSLAHSEAGVLEVLATVGVEGGTFSAQLVPQIATALERLRIKVEAVNGIAACIGPGSFTGLRIGLAAVKGLVEVLDLPVAGISSLEALASASGADAPVVAALDARRGEIFAAAYEKTGRAFMLRGEMLCNQSQFIGFAGKGLVVTPDAWIADVATNAGATVRVVDRISSEVIADLGWRKLEGGMVTPIEELDAHYLRRDDNLFFKQR